MAITEQIDAAHPGSPKKANPASKWILVISGQEVIRDLLERFFEIDGHFVSTAADAAEGLQKAKLLPIDLIVLDNELSTSTRIRAQFQSDAAISHLPVLWVGGQSANQNFQSVEGDQFLKMP